MFIFNELINMYFGNIAILQHKKKKKKQINLLKRKKAIESCNQNELKKCNSKKMKHDITSIDV